MPSHDSPQLRQRFLGLLGASFVGIARSPCLESASLSQRQRVICRRSPHQDLLPAGGDQPLRKRHGPARASCKRFDGRLALRWSFPAGCGLLVRDGYLPGEPDPLPEERRDPIQPPTSTSAGVVTKTGSCPVGPFPRDHLRTEMCGPAEFTSRYLTGCTAAYRMESLPIWRVSR